MEAAKINAVLFHHCTQLLRNNAVVVTITLLATVLWQDFHRTIFMRDHIVIAHIPLEINRAQVIDERKT